MLSLIVLPPASHFLVVLCVLGSISYLTYLFRSYSRSLGVSGPFEFDVTDMHLCENSCIVLILLFPRSAYTYTLVEPQPRVPTDHDSDVRRLASQVEGFYRRNESFRIYHGKTSSTRPTRFRRDRILSTSHLTRVLSVDTKNNTALVEPNVTIYNLVSATLARGMLPKVVMEFPDVTIGGAFSGASGNSSCFRYGLFEQTIDWIEIILADSQVVSASPEENPDLFYGAAGTFGTLGVVTLLRVQCILAQPFVELRYEVLDRMENALRRLEQEADNPKNDYVDAIVFQKNLAVVMSGCLTSKHGQTQSYTRRSDPWFCMHASMIAEARKSAVVTIPIVDYLFRYDRGAFWGGNEALRYFGLPCNRWTCWLLDHFLRASPLTQVIHTAKLARSFIIQDLAVPIENASSLLKYIDQKFVYYPIWLCPVTDVNHDKATFTSGAASKVVSHPDKLVDIGLYGLSFNSEETFRRLNRDLETALHAHGGQKALFASSYYTQEEFWKVYNHEWYTELRRKYHATSLPTVFDKMQGANEFVLEAERKGFTAWLVAYFWRTRPLPGFYGLWKYSIGGDYLIHS